MEVILTVENNEGGRGSVSAHAPDYESAYSAARALVPQDCKAIVIRTKNDE